MKVTSSSRILTNFDANMDPQEIIRRIRVRVIAFFSGIWMSSGRNRKLTKLLVNVTIEQSLGPLHILISPENTVEDLIRSALNVYLREKRRPLLMESDPCCFDLHYSQFSFESLNPKERLIELGSRNFYLCSRRISPVNSRYSHQAKKTAIDHYSPFTWTMIMDFLL